MSGSTMLLFAVPTWIAIGLVLAFVLGRRGHDSFSWFVIGAMLGPLGIALAITAWRQHEDARAETLAPAVRGADGTVDALVGFDGSPESRAAIASVVDLFGARLGRLTLLTVIPYDGGRFNEREARAALERERDRLAWLAPGLSIVRGRPAAALAATAVEGGFDVLAVGTTGAGHAHLFGSAASQLAGNSKVPVLLAGGAAAPSHAPADDN